MATKRSRLLRTLCGMLLAFSLLLPARGYSQEIVLNNLADEGHEIPLRKDTVASIISFTVKTVNDTAYLKWTVQNMRYNGVFVVYSSTDGKHFRIIGTKNAIGSPIKAPIDYYLKDLKAGKEPVYYRVIYLSALSEYLITGTVVAHEKKTLAGIGPAETK